MALGQPTSNSGAPKPLKAPFAGYPSRQHTSDASSRPSPPVLPAAPNQETHQHVQFPPRAPLSDPFVSPRLGLSPNSSFIPYGSNNGWQVPGQDRSSSFHSQQVLARRRPKWALPMPQRFLPFQIPNSRFVQYMRQRPNVRVHAFPFIEIFPATLEPPRAAQELAERILCLLNIKSLLRCQRVSRQFHSTIRNSANLQRRMWFIDTHHPVSSPDDPLAIDTIILGLRHDLDLLFECTPNGMFSRILYARSGQPITLQDSGYSSWRRMLVVRSGERDKYWQIVIAGAGVINLGSFMSPPTFGHVVDAIADVMVHGGKRYKILR